MAEARSAIDLYYLQKRGFQIAGVEDGYYTVTVSLPYPTTLLQSLVMQAKHIWRYIQNRIFPARTRTVLSVMILVTGLTLYSSPTSWIRSGPIANILWTVDSKLNILNPVHTHIPTQIKVGYLASITAFFSFLGLMALERVILRLLLTYTGWLYMSVSDTKRPPLKLKLWGGLVSLFSSSGKLHLTYGYSLSLPNLPLPSLKHTVENYIDSITPIISSDQLNITKQVATEFLHKEGPKLQRYLWLKRMFSVNYVADWWENYVYLRGRTPLCINSNYYITDSKFRPTNSQTQRAANIVSGFLQFKELIETETLEPLLIRNKVPLCMKQYERMFGTTRIPNREQDVLKHTDGVRHISVLYKGVWVVLDVYHGVTGTALRALNREELKVQLDDIVVFVDDFLNSEKKKQSEIEKGKAGEEFNKFKRSKIKSYSDLVVLNSKLKSVDFALDGKNNNNNNNNRSSDSPEVNVASLTCLPRSQWAELREVYFSDGLNRASLLAIEKSAFVLVLDNSELPANRLSTEEVLNQRAKKLFTGDGGNRYFDKSVCLVVFKDGYAGVNAEHSWADAPPVAHLWEFALLKELSFYTNVSQSSNVTSAQSTLSSTKREKKWRQLEWEKSTGLLDVYQTALTVNKELIADIDLFVVEFDSFGSTWMKRHGFSPDAFVQTALQLAYFRDRGRFDLTYESSMTRLFRKGRTETVRSLSSHSCAFVLSINDKSVSDKERLTLLNSACEEHNKRSKDAMAGKGVDRHLFALYIVSRGFEIESKFLNSALSVPWRLSTSQQTQNQTDLRSLLTEDVARKFVSPGGGFGPVADDGYGVSYMMVSNDKTDEIFFHVSSKKSATETESERFARNITTALSDMKDLAEKVQKETK